MITWPPGRRDLRLLTPFSKMRFSSQCQQLVLASLIHLAAALKGTRFDMHIVIGFSRAPIIKVNHQATGLED